MGLLTEIGVASAIIPGIITLKSKQQYLPS